MSVGGDPISACAAKVYSNVGNPEVLDLLPPESRRVLDIGCGAGDDARLLKNRGHRVVGVTCSRDEGASARAWCDEVLIVDVEHTDLNLPLDSFDAILLSHVLEHLRDPRWVLNRLARYLRPGGLIVIAVPNMAFWRVRVRMLCGDWRRDSSGFLDETHLHFWTYMTAAEVLTNTPFRLIIQLPGSTTLPLWPARQFVPRVCGQIDRILGNRWPNLAAMQVLLLGQKGRTQ